MVTKKSSRVATRAFMRVFWKLLYNPHYRERIGNVGDHPRKKHTPVLLRDWAYWYCVWKTPQAEAAKKLIEIANDTSAGSPFHPTNPLPATGLNDWLQEQCKDLDSINPRDHDLHGDEGYDSMGLCRWTDPITGDPCPRGWTELWDGLCIDHRIT